jgi:hypothetical protein
VRDRLDLAKSKGIQFFKVKDAFFVLTTVALLTVTVVDEGIMSFL